MWFIFHALLFNNTKIRQFFNSTKSVPLRIVKVLKIKGLSKLY
nr:MAG TPA: hypothetical protein [Caudoviricetes sp.]